MSRDVGLVGSQVVKYGGFKTAHRSAESAGLKEAKKQKTNKKLALQ